MTNDIVRLNNREEMRTQENVASNSLFTDRNDAEVSDIPNASETTSTGNSASDAVPHGTQSKTRNRTVQLPNLVSMWKYLLSSRYANKRLELYTFLNKYLRMGYLSEIVGSHVLNRVINREACNFTGVTFWKIDREDFYADIGVDLTLKTTTGYRCWNGVIVCWCSFEEERFSMSIEDLVCNVDRKADGLTLFSPFLVPYYTNRQMDVFSEKIWVDYNMPEAIGNPCLRNATKLAHRMGLTIMFADVYEHQNVDSILFFADGELNIGKDRIIHSPNGTKTVIKADSPTTNRIPANTIALVR